MFAIRHIKTNEIIYAEKDYLAIEHNGNHLMIGFDGKVYNVQCGYYDSPFLDIEDVSDEYEIVIVKR